MNHTIKGVIIVVVITSMLVLGAATTVPIMQNSFASKKHDFKGAERDPNTNTNINTNTADSSSSSDATASNTNNINNTATATQSQEQDACAVAVTCPEGSTTVTPSTSIAGCPSGTLYDITTRADESEIPANTELCLPQMLGEQTATIAGTSTTITVVVTDPDVTTCPTINPTVKADVTSGTENVPFTTVCVHLPLGG